MSSMRGRSWLVVGFAVLLAALLAAFTVLGVRSRTESRQQAEKRFTGEAGLAARMTSALLSSSVTSSEQSATKELGSRVVSSATLDKLGKAPGIAYVLVLDADGKVIGASSGSTAAARAKTIARQAHVRSALAGRAWLSNVLASPASAHGHVVEWALPFDSPSGRRVAVEAFDPAILSRFFGDYLAQAAKSGGGAAFILDRNARVLGDGSGKIAPGGRPQSTGLLGTLATRDSGTYSFDGSQRFFATSPVAGSTWRVVMTVRTSDLYPALAGTDGWFLYAVLAAFAVVGAAGLFFFRRALVAGSAIRRTNAELRALNTTLEERVAERTAAAEDRARELARSNAELEQFSSIASHDLQEPLRKIRMFGDRLRERLGGALEPEPAGDLDRIQNAAARMQRLINDLLEFSRVSHRGNAFEPVDLGRVTEEVKGDLEARIVELDARVEVGELPVIEADRTQMRQLIQNLVGNALKFHRAGVPPVVTIRSAIVNGQEPRFPGESQPAGRAVITIADNGIGFEQKHAERVFAAFERLNGLSAYDGTGIGLSIVRKIVWRHGGQVAAAGVPGEGATFTVTLPLRQVAANGNGGGAGS